MRKSFFTGLAILLPIVATVIIVVVLVNLLTAPFRGIVEGMLTYYDIVSTPELLHFVSRLLALFLMFAIILGVGLLGRLILVHYFIKFGDAILHKIPIFNRVYKAAQDVVHTLFGSEERAFSQVVLAPYPHKKAWSLGLVTSDSLSEESDAEHAGLVSVFIPATPNPTVGYILLYKREQLIFIDTRVDEALKIIVSCGVMIGELANNKEKTGE